MCEWVTLKGEWVFMVLGSHYSESLAGKWCSEASRWGYSPYLYINPAILYLINVYEYLLEWVWVQATKSFLGKLYFSNIFVLVFYGKIYLPYQGRLLMQIKTVSCSIKRVLFFSLSISFKLQLRKKCSSSQAFIGHFFDGPRLHKLSQ